MVRILTVVAMLCINIVSAVYTKGDPAMMVTLCPIGKGTIDNSAKCSYAIGVRTEKNGKLSQLKLASADCHHAEIKNTAYVFQRKLAATTSSDSLQVKSPCSAGAVDHLDPIVPIDDTPCRTYASPICVSKQK